MPSMIFSHKLLVIRNYVIIICIKTDDLAKLKHFNIKTKTLSGMFNFLRITYF